MPVVMCARPFCRRPGAKAAHALALVLALAGGAATAQACSVNRGGTTSKNNYYAAYDASLFQIRVPPGRASFPLPAYPVAGETLFVAEMPLPELGSGSAQGRAAPLYACNAGAVETFRGGTALVAGHPDVYASGVQGIGYRVYYYYIDASQNEVAPYSASNTYKSGALVFPFNGSASMGTGLKARIEFVATGEPILPGQLSPSNVYGQAAVSNVGNVAVPQLYRVQLATPVAVTPPTCDVQNPAALTVRLPAVPVHLLSASPGRDITSTSIEVACSSPSEASPTVTIIPTSTVAGYPATLANQESGASAADGVGVQVWVYDPAADAYRLPAFGVAEPGLGAPMEGVPSRRWRYLVGASYVQVAAPVRAGKVRASATLKFTYP